MNYLYKYMNPYLDIIFRCFAVYIFMIIAMRITGKTELAQLSVIDFVLILLISNSVQNAMVGDNITLLGGLTAAGALFILHGFFKISLYYSKSFRSLVQGEPLLLIYNGVVNEKNLRSARLPQGELEAACREHGVEEVEQVNLAILETDGNISILSSNFHSRTQHQRKENIENRL